MPAISSFTAMPCWVAGLVLTASSCGLDQRAVDVAAGGGGSGGGDPELQNGSMAGQDAGGTGGTEDVPPACEPDGSCVCTEDCPANCSGCSIGSECVAAQSVPAGNPCQICDPARSTTAYSINANAECGAEPTECSGQDTCDAQGQCAPNHLPATTACTSQPGGQCDGSGQCTADPFAGREPLRLLGINEGSGGGFLINGAAGEPLGPVASGRDVNGDGRGDVLIGVPTAPGGGQAYLLFGLNRTAPLSLSAFNNGQGNGFLITGPPLGPGAQRGEFGLRAALVGDIDLDGRPDLVLTTPTSVSFPEQQGAGYVVFGKQSGTGVAAASVAAGLGGGFVFNGTGSVPNVAGVGDQNGDGREDIAVTLFVDGGQSAIVRVVFGQSELTPATGGFDIVSTEIAAGILSVAGAGDVNGDGRPDIIIGGQRVRDNNLGYVAYVVFGPATAATISLNAIEDGQGGGFVIQEARFNDFAGIASVAGVGDLNGDGRSDVLVGAPGAPSNDNPGGGRAYVVFGKETVTALSLTTLEAGEGGGFSIDGGFVSDRAGTAVSGIGDQNGDGVRDLLIGAPGSDAETGSATGVAYVVFGKRDASPVSLSEVQQGEAGGFAIFGAANLDQAGDTLASGDINGDGTDDILIGAPGVGDAGGIYVVFGGS